MRILLVEDDSAIAHMLMRFLKEESYAVDHIADGIEVEWTIFEHSYDLIILDIMLPRQSGIEVLKKVREQNIKTNILMLTARDDTDSIVEVLDLGADDYLTKPFKLAEMAARIRALLRRQNKDFVNNIITINSFCHLILTVEN